MGEKEQAGKMILYIACSLDGYIAGENDDLSFLTPFEKPDEDYGYAEFMKTIDTVIMGKRTLDWVLKNAPGFSYSDKETYIISHSNALSFQNEPLTDNKNGINNKDHKGDSKPPSTYKYYSGNLKILADRLLSENKRIFLVGGAEIILQMMKHKLIDEFKIAIIPVLLGGGIPLFKEGYPSHSLKLTDVHKYDNGLVMLVYIVEY